LENPKILNYKSVESMNPTEILTHTTDMLVGVDIILDSEVCVLDYQSNVSRFIKLAHKKNLVYDVLNTEIDMDKTICPAYSF
jgi:hypothetical protein